jgi:hypothetical protein
VAFSTVRKEYIDYIEAKSKSLRHWKRGLLKDFAAFVCSFDPLSLSAFRGWWGSFKEKKIIEGVH